MLSCVFNESLILKWKTLAGVCTFDNAIVLVCRLTEQTTLITLEIWVVGSFSHSMENILDSV